MAGIYREICDNRSKVSLDTRFADGNRAIKSSGLPTIYINGSFVTSKLRPQDFDACWDREEIDTDYLRIHDPRLLNHYDRAGQKARYKGEIFPSDQPIGNYGMNSFELFQRDREQNQKGIIAIDLVRWEP